MFTQSWAVLRSLSENCLIGNVSLSLSESFFFFFCNSWAPFVGVKCRIVSCLRSVPHPAAVKSAVTTVLAFSRFLQAPSHFLFCALQIRLCYNDLFTVCCLLLNCQFRLLWPWEETCCSSLFHGHCWLQRYPSGGGWARILPGPGATMQGAGNCINLLLLSVPDNLGESLDRSLLLCLLFFPWQP